MGENSKLRLYLYYLVIFLLSLGAFYSFEYLTGDQSSDYFYVQKCFLCAVSSFFNLFVLFYHYTHPPHPKFVILPQRRFSIYVHIVSGLIELVACWLAFFTGSPIIGKIASLAAICGHVPTAYYQTSIVFGAKALMVSGYLFAISLHLFSAIHLFFEPTSIFWLLNMFLIHNIYVWCRVFYFFFGFVGVFKESLYTNSILTSGLILFPAVLGASANMLFLGYVALSIILYFVIVGPNQTERNRFVNECTRDILVNKETHENWIKEREHLAKLAENDQLTDQQRAKQAFDDSDQDKNGSLDDEEIDRLLKEWKVAESFLRRFKNYSRKHPMSFDVFYRDIWRVSQTSVNIVEAGIKREGMAKAKFVFDTLDLDQSGFIEAFELEKLLIQWGLPTNEVEAYMAEDEDEQFSFEEFYQNLKPIWDFAYENMLIRSDQQQTNQHHHHPE